MPRAPRADEHRLSSGLVAACCALAALCACKSKEKPQPAPAPAPQPSAPPAPAAAIEVRFGPWLLEPSATEVTVAWTTREPAAGKVSYGEGALDQSALEAQPARDHRVRLSGLTANHLYRYKLEGSSEEGSFTTAPEPAGEAASQVPFRVLIYGDNRSDEGAHAEVVRAAKDEGARLALHTGDMVVDAKKDELWTSWFAVEHDLLARTPIAATVGNHEITDRGKSYTAHFQAPSLPPYRSFDYGPLHVVVLDSFELVSSGAQPREGGISDAQRAWLNADLLAVPNDRHVWVLIHQGPFSHPLGHGHGGSEGVRRALAPLHQRIEGVFAGHDHYYERGKRDGLRYFVLGGGGAPLYEPNPKAKGVQVAVKSLSYAVIDVCGCHASGVVKAPGGKVLDRFELATCAAACPPPAPRSAATGSEARP
jgi:hypothetical protein